MLNASSKTGSARRAKGEGRSTSEAETGIPVKAGKVQQPTQGELSPKLSVLSAGIPWNPWLAVVLIIFVYYASQVIAASVVSIYPILHGWSTVRANDWLNSSVWGQFFYVFIAEGLTLGALYAFIRAYKIPIKRIGLRKPKWTDPLWGLAMLPAYYLSYVVVLALAHDLVPAINVNQSQQLGFNDVLGFGNLTLTFISLVILPPIVEEIMVRGFLYTSLRKNMSQIAAAVVASIIFASAHLQAGSGAPLLWVAAIDTFTLSLFLIYLREKTGGLYASMTLHGLKNLLAFLSLFVFHWR